MDLKATVQDIFRTQADRFRPEAAASLDAVVAYDLSGEGGGRFRITIKDGHSRTEQVAGELGASGVTIVTSTETFVGMTLGTVDAQEAFAAGRVTLQGDMGLAMKLPRLFTKYVPRSPGTGGEGEVTAALIVATLPARFRPEKAAGMTASIGYDITGTGGGQWTAVVEGGRCRLEEGLGASPTVVQTVSARDFVDLVLGKLDPLTALGGGRLRIQGDMDVARALPRIFARYEPPTRGTVVPELIVLKRNISVNMRYATGAVMGRFLDALRDRKLLANVCPRCGRRQIPPREICAPCRCRATEFVEVGPEGVLVFLDIIYYASPDPLTGRTRQTPYGDIRVLLDGCTGRDTFWHLLRPEDLAETGKGDRLRPVWADERTGRIEDILHFEKVRS